jgi:hypothetical protein
MYNNYKTSSQIGMKEFRQNNGYSISNLSDRQIEKTLKIAMLEQLKESLRYWINTSKQFEESYQFFIANTADDINGKRFNSIELIKSFKLPYPKLDKVSYIRFIKIFEKCHRDYLTYTSKLDMLKVFNNGGI